MPKILLNKLAIIIEAKKINLTISFFCTQKKISVNGIRFSIQELIDAASNSKAVFYNIDNELGKLNRQNNRFQFKQRICLN